MRHQAWSPSKNRSLWSLLQGATAGTCGVECEKWEKFTGSTTYVVNSRKYLIDPKDDSTKTFKTGGTYQGFTVFTESSVHRAMWAEIIHELQIAGLRAVDTTHLHVFMDDVMFAESQL